MSKVDLLAILPYFVSFVMEELKVNAETDDIHDGHECDDDHDVYDYDGDHHHIHEYDDSCCSSSSLQIDCSWRRLYTLSQIGIKRIGLNIAEKATSKNVIFCVTRCSGNDEF